ncbi:MAG: ABC transporter permease [Caldilineaceae bacterium]|nr:ABC transporter permease [Caldilineaceae bacterium]
MQRFIIQRFIYMVVTLFFVSVVGFVIINLPPGSYVDVYRAQLEAQGTPTTERQLQGVINQYALDKPLYVQYWKWVSGFVRGDFGRSFQYNRDVSELIWERLGLTMLISIAALLFTWAVAIPIGIYSATHQYSIGDNLFTFIGLIGLSIPNFLLALIIMVIAALGFGQSVGGLFSPAYVDAPWSLGKVIDLLKHLWIPVIVVGMSGTAGLMRIMRGNLLDVLKMAYITSARAKGLQERRVIYGHALRNAIHPLIMILGSSLPQIISGATIVSMVLSLPTTGPLYFAALRQQDMYLAGTFLVFLAGMLVIGNFLADLLLVWVDPRIRYE